MDIIEGVRILTQEEVLVKANSVGWIFLIVFFSAFAIFAILNFIFTLKENNKVDKGSIFIAAMLIACLVLLIKGYGILNEYRTEYMVEVSDEASFNEFYHKYKVIEDKGNNVYIVYEKEQLS